VADLERLSIEDLANIEISSVSKVAQPLSEAPAAIYVITHDDIVRSGATTVPEMLRLAPNLEVEQTSASGYVITARGFNGSSAAQNFSDKLLVLIDGRSVYSPLYSGVYWDMQDVLPEDVDRIEVISGPGATLWGANAVNGVINIITRKSADTQGVLLEAQGGNQVSTIDARLGGHVGADLTYRVYARYLHGEHTLTTTGASADDDWTKPQGGFRVDWTATPKDTLTLQGDAYRGSEAQAGAADQTIGGQDFVGRWNHAWSPTSALQVQMYYDHVTRSTPAQGEFGLDTFDLDVQHNFSLGARNAVVWGGGVRTTHYQIDGTPIFFFTPSARTLNLVNLFVQDTLSITSALKLTLGMKMEHDPYTGWAALPSARLSWKLNERTLFWAAASRAIRSATPFDRDVNEILGGILFLAGSDRFRPEDVVTYETGVRAQPTSNLSLSVSGFYNVYDHLRSIEFDPVTLLPLRWGNMLRGDTFGVEAWADFKPVHWWRLSAGFNILEERFAFKQGASQLLGLEQLGDDPEYQVSGRSSMDLGSNVTLDADIRYTGALPNPALPAYVELNTRLAWRVTDHIELSIAGRNLIHDQHQELPPPASAIPRSFLAGLQWRY